MARFKTVSINIDNNNVVVDHDLRKNLNFLAGKFYETKGYVNRKGFDFYGSNHPMEREMFALALTAYIFNRDIGLD